MDIWVIEGKRKTGPYQSYQVRERIERGELDGSEMAWHESCTDWIPLRTMELFREEFVPEVQPAKALPPPLPVKPRPFVRFWARWFDLHVYLGLVFGIMRLLDLDMLAALASLPFVLTYLIPWVLLDAIMIHLFGTTPGKALLGIRVEMQDGSRLPLGTSLRRAFRVFVFGMGMNLSVFIIICHGLSLWYTLRMREALWDRLTGHTVRVASGSVVQTAVFVTLFLVVLTVSGLIMKPASDEMLRRLRETFPQLEEPASGKSA